MSPEELSLLTQLIDSKFENQTESRKRDFQDLKKFYTDGLAEHKRKCAGANLAENLITTGKLLKVLYVAVPVSVILSIVGVIRNILHF
jgi:hypothetical protein